MSPDDAVELDTVDLRGTYNLRHVPFVSFEESADVLALERLKNPPPASEFGVLTSTGLASGRGDPEPERSACRRRS
jgi:hypothetical protein